jgi:hypothetical protein
MEGKNVVFAMRAQQNGRRIKWEHMWMLAGRVFEGRRRVLRRSQDREGVEEIYELQRQFNEGTWELMNERWEWVCQSHIPHATWYMPMVHTFEVRAREAREREARKREAPTRGAQA